MIPWVNEPDLTISAALIASDRLPQHINTVALLIGPEGGFTESEIEAAQSTNITPITLGPRILRAETAAVVATALTFHELGEMS